MERLKKKKGLYVVVKILALSFAALLQALNVNSFLNAGGLLAGGITGIAILIQRILATFFSIDLPYSPIYYVLNIVPVIIGFVHVGKKFTFYTLYFVVLSGILTDVLPPINITGDILLIALFGGLITGVAISLTLIFSASTGGFDFLSIYLAEKRNVSSWNLMLAINAGILFIGGLLFGWDKALYSIIYQFVLTEVLNILDKRYQKDTLIIVTDQPESVMGKIRSISNHGATVWEGVGEYAGEKRKIVYSVVGRAQARKVVYEIKKIDNDAFINVLQTDQLEGRFNKEKRD